MCVAPTPPNSRTFSLHSSWLPWPSAHRKSCSKRSSHSACWERLARPPGGASLMSVRADSNIISRRLAKTGTQYRPCNFLAPRNPSPPDADSYLRLMQSGGRTSVAEAPSWVSTEKTWPRSRQAASALPSTPRHVTENSTLVSKLHNSSSGVCCGDRKVVWAVGCGGGESLLSTPCLPTGRNEERQHSANSETGTKALEKWPKGFSHFLNSGGKPGVLLDFREEIFTKALL